MHANCDTHSENDADICNHSNLIGIVPQSCLQIYSEAGKTLRITSDKVVELLHFLKRCEACIQDS